jgi:D-cysteine desulfhydrase
MNLAIFPRRRYTEGETPIEFLSNFTKAIGGPNIYIKRDDLLGLTSGGNKTRKLEFLVADALSKGTDTLITCGAVQSNHCRLTLSAAVKEGLKCQLVLEERVTGSYRADASGNNFLFRLLGVEKITVVPGGSNMLDAMNKVSEELAKEGRRGYVIPGGGSNPIGATGYVACAQEIQEQLFEKNIRIDRIVTASGSAGTHAGLLAGVYGCNMNIPIVGIGVARDPEDQDPLVYDLALKTAQRVGVRQEIPRDAVVTFGDYWRPQYSVPNKKMVEAVNLMARTEGILLDPVYTGKAMAGLIDLIRKGYFHKEDQ